MKEEQKIRIRVVDIGDGDLNIEDINHEDNAITITPTEAAYLLGILEMKLK